MNTTKHMAFVFVIVVMCFTAGSVDAAPRKGIGLQFGLGLDPDQFVIGLQSDWGSVAQNIRFVPSAHAGIGEDIGFDFNADFQIPLFALARSSSTLYASFGPTLFIFDPDQGGSDTEIGASFAAGITNIRLGETFFYNAELRLGIGDIPEVRILAGIWI